MLRHEHDTTFSAESRHAPTMDESLCTYARLRSRMDWRVPDDCTPPSASCSFRAFATYNQVARAAPRATNRVTTTATVTAAARLARCMSMLAGLHSTHRPLVQFSDWVPTQPRQKAPVWFVTHCFCAAVVGGGENVAVPEACSARRSLASGFSHRAGLGHRRKSVEVGEALQNPGSATKPLVVHFGQHTAFAGHTFSSSVSSSMYRPQRYAKHSVILSAPEPSVAGLSAGH